MPPQRPLKENKNFQIPLNSDFIILVILHLVHSLQPYISQVQVISMSCPKDVYHSKLALPFHTSVTIADSNLVPHKICHTC